ncbi:MAG TPA: proline dehydrogenase family protein [Acidobacteriaceae bacterium]|nr:proline dehydrogenase family protein [Acidobacteriaceae bacterium]
MLRSFFIGLSTNKPFRKFSENSSIGRRVSHRFVAGMAVEEAIAAAAELNREGIVVTLDALGESVTDAPHAEASAAVYHRLLDEIASHKLNANVSLKLTQMGMDVGGANSAEGQALAERIVGNLVAHAGRLKNFLRIDMEGSEYTEATIAITERLFARFPGAVGTVLQAYMFRTDADADRLLRQGIRIRLCKGAYKEPPEIAFPAKADVDANYLKLARRMMTSGVFCGIATHDEAIIDELCRFTDAHSIEKSAFEFQMLYGIRRDLQRKLVHKGFGVRVYVPFGTEWYPYFMRRLAERPANVFFLAKNFFRT